MAQIVIPPINLPTVPKDWMSTAVGLIASICILLQEYLKTHGTISLEVVAIAVVIAVICYFIPAKLSKTEQAALAAMIATQANNTLGAKIPAVLTEEHTVDQYEQAALDTAAQLGPNANPSSGMQLGA